MHLGSPAQVILVAKYKVRLVISEMCTWFVTFLSTFLSQVSKIVEKQDKNGHDDVVRDEWRAVSKVIDRLFFWICLLVITIVLIVLFCDLEEHEL